MATITQTGSIVLIPSGTTGTTNLTTSTSSTNAVSNGYNDSSNTGNPARFTLSQSTAGYVYYTFAVDTSDIPANATITSISAKARVYVNNTTRVTNTNVQLYTGTTAKGSSSAFSTTTTTNTVTLTTGSWTRSELNDLRIRIGATGSSSGSSKYIYFKGADVTVNYSYTVTTYDVTVTNNSTATVSASNTTPLAGEDVTITASTLSNITVTDNNTNVTSQFTQLSGGTESYYPSSNTNSNFTITSIDNAYAGSDNTTSATLDLAGGTTGTLYLNFSGINIPTGANIQSVTAQATVQFSGNGSSSGFTSSMQMYSGSTAKGSATSWVSSATNVAKTTYTLTVGSWTASELENAKFYLTATNSARSTHRYIYVYGVTLSVTYSLTNPIYVYTISNIAADHTIVFSGGAVVHVTGVTLNKSSTSIVEGKTEQLTATVTPNDATNKSVTWSSGNTSVATVSNGLVTAVSAGTAVITVTTTDGSYTDTCTVTVTEPVRIQYKLTTSMQVGKSYIIANGNSGSVYMLSDESGGSRQLKSVAATVSGNIISLTEDVAETVLFNCVRYTSGNDVTITVEKGGKYLYCDNSNGLRMNAPATLDRFWHYRDTKFWQFKSTASDGYDDTSSEYKYYLTLSGSNFTDSHVDTAGIEASTIPAIYIYTEYVPSNDKLYIKLESNNWTEADTVYKKVNGSWVEQTDLTNVFSSGTNYKVV